MTLGVKAIVSPSQVITNVDAPRVRPSDACANWVVVCSAPKTADNGGSTVVQPGAITRAELKALDVRSFGSTVHLSFQYETGASAITDPEVQVFGFDDNDVPFPLYTKDEAHEVTLATDTTNDVRDGTWKYTEPVEILLAGASFALVTVKTAAAGTNLTAPNILARVL